MAPDPKKGPQNGQKKKGYNPYNKFKNQSWNKKKKPNNDSAAKATDGRHPPNASHVPATSPVKVIQTPISKRATNFMVNSVVCSFSSATYIDVTQQPARYRGWSLYFPETSKAPPGFAFLSQDV